MLWTERRQDNYTGRSWSLTRTLKCAPKRVFNNRRCQLPSLQAPEAISVLAQVPPPWSQLSSDLRAMLGPDGEVSKDSGNIINLHDMSGEGPMG